MKAASSLSKSSTPPKSESESFFKPKFSLDLWKFIFTVNWFTILFESEHSVKKHISSLHFFLHFLQSYYSFWWLILVKTCGKSDIMVLYQGENESVGKLCGLFDLDWCCFFGSSIVTLNDWWSSGTGFSTCNLALNPSVLVLQLCAWQFLLLSVV